MRGILHYALTAIVVAFYAHQAAAQPITGCPPGQAMQASSPSGKQVTCVPVLDVGTVNAAVSAEAAARASGDADLSARISALSETDIIGRWAVTGTTDCFQSSNGFNPQTYSPNIPLPGSGSTNVSRLGGTFIGTRIFYAGGKGRSVGTSHSMTFNAMSYFGTTTQPFFSASPGFAGGASVATLDASFDWTIRSDGMLVIDDDNLIAQPLIAPSSMLGQTVTIENVPPFVGYISKDKRTILLTHNDMAVETSVRRDASGTVLGRTPRFCARSRVLTRLPN